jgi:hypothetical protein
MWNRLAMEGMGGQRRFKDANERKRRRGWTKIRTGVQKKKTGLFLVKTMAI